MENQTAHEGKTTAIISYLWWIGLLIAFIMNNDKKNSFASFHIRQMIGILLMSAVNYFIVRELISPWGANLISLLILVLWIVGLIGAIQGEEKKVPLLGDQFQDWFKNIG